MNSTRGVYLDHNATSPSPRAHLQALAELIESTQGNPSSPHSAGRGAHVALTEVRKKLAHALGFDVAEIVFVSGGSEANNLGTAGVLRAREASLETAHVVCSALEHPSIVEPLDFLVRTKGLHGGVEKSLEKSVLPVNSWGHLSAQTVVESLRPETALITLMAANNETGSVLPVREFGEWLHRRRWATDRELLVPHPLDAFLDARVTRDQLRALHFHVDAVQAFGKIPHSEWASPGFDSVAVCAHKLGGLSGIGALALRRGRKFQPLVLGGAQERSRRAGTENLAGVLSFGLVLEQIEGPNWWTQIEAMRAKMGRLRAGLAQYNSVLFNSPIENALPNTLNFCVQGPKVRGEDVLMELDMQGICASSGSACSSGANMPSKVLLALGRTPEQAKNGVRMSLGVGITDSQIDRTLAVLGRCLG